MREKYWQLEFMCYNFLTHELELIKAEDDFIKSATFEEADSLIQELMSGLWRLSGKAFLSPEEARQDSIKYNSERTNIGTTTEQVTDSDIDDALIESVKNMNFDEFNEWLSLGTEKAVKCALGVFEERGMIEHVKMTKGYINHKFKDEEEKESDNKEEKGER